MILPLDLHGKCSATSDCSIKVQNSNCLEDETNEMFKCFCGSNFKEEKGKCIKGKKLY